jgi:hypothetical protein
MMDKNLSWEIISTWVKYTDRQEFIIKNLKVDLDVIEEAI